MLTDSEIERFIVDGFVAVRSAVPPPVIARCHQELCDQLAEQGIDLDDPTSWTEPVVRFWCPESPAFAEAGTQAVLWEAYDQLLGPGVHVERQGVGGSVPVRFPSSADPGDAGWHIDGSIPIGDTWGIRVDSVGRGLLCLFLFSDVGPVDAPTELKLGSHLLVPPSVERLGPEGGLFDLHATDVKDDVLALPSAFATGAAGDVFLCHPFLTHRATWPHSGAAPRFMAQPEIGIHQPFPLTGDGEVFPVERAILMGLGR